MMGRFRLAKYLKRIALQLSRDRAWFESLGYDARIVAHGSQARNWR
jgi:hypothetical protein